MTRQTKKTPERRGGSGGLSEKRRFEQKGTCARMAAEFFAPLPSDSGHRFDEKRAAHLLRRTGFGASPAEIAACVERGLADAVDGLFQAPEDEAEKYARAFDVVNGGMLNFGDADTCRAWWLLRMVSTAAPFREKLALFWHGHFATSVDKVEDTRLMLGQLDLFRRQAWGTFRDLVLAIAQDPAMLVWLDGESNTQEHPNENFARELMELFTVGIGHYTEQDVQEAARAFTGWHREAGAFVFHAEAHDAGVKRILGKSGRFNGGDVVNILVAQPETARFLARKLLRFFATPQPAADVVAAAAELLDRTQLNIEWFLRDLFQSRYFYSDACYRQRIASPVEFVVGTVRTLGVRQPAPELAGNLAGMGQRLLSPPNVKGWDGEQEWVNSTTLAARAAFAETIAGLNAEGNALQPDCPIATRVSPEITAPDQVVERLAEVLFQGDLPAAVRQELAAFLVLGDNGPQPDAFRDDEGFRAAKTRDLLAVMLALPEYQAY